MPDTGHEADDHGDDNHEEEGGQDVLQRYDTQRSASATPPEENQDPGDEGEQGQLKPV
jgi:hypothetical protein